MQPSGELITHDGTRLILYHRPATTAAGPRALVALVHGLGEHAGRYAHVAAALAHAGYEPFAFDLRGHGRSPGARGWAPSASVMLADIDALVDRARAARPGLPVVLYGHSLGGLLVLAWALRDRQALPAGTRPPAGPAAITPPRPPAPPGVAAGSASAGAAIPASPAVAALVATSPALAPGLPPPRWKLLAARSLGRLFPRMTLRTGLDTAGLSRDPAVEVAYRADPLVHDRIGARLALELLALGEAVLSRAGALTIPTLLLHGTADPLTSFAASRAFAAASGCRLLVRQGGLHELHNEPEGAQLLAQITTWLDDVL